MSIYTYFMLIFNIAYYVSTYLSGFEAPCADESLAENPLVLLYPILGVLGTVKKLLQG